MTGYRDGFPVYHKLGWSGVLLLGAYTKDPPPTAYTGHDGIDPSYADMWPSGEQHPGGNLALRLSGEVVGIDVDNYGKKTGAKTLAEAEKRWGALPPSYRSTSRDDGVSGIKLFRVLRALPGAAVPLRWRDPRRGRHRRDHAVIVATNHIVPNVHRKRRRRRQSQCAATAADRIPGLRNMFKHHVGNLVDGIVVTTSSVADSLNSGSTVCTYSSVSITENRTHRPVTHIQVGFFRGRRHAASRMGLQPIPSRLTGG
jgi:Bifunctional DNA primase/polymerase, N-terminal